MRKLAIGVVALIFCSVIPQSVHPEIYRWIDEKGGVHFTEDPATIPEKYRDKAKGRLTDEDLMSPEERARAIKKNEEAVKDRWREEQRAYEKSLEEERQRKLQKEREYTEYEEQIRTKKSEGTRSLSEQQKKNHIEIIETPPIRQREEKRVECSNCRGKGYIPCVRCNPGGAYEGTRFKGKIEKTYFGSTGPRTIYVTCPDCNGSGEKRCPQCNGVGYVWGK